MTGGGLLVYSDGGKGRRPYASFAAYEVGPGVDWGSDFEAHRKLSCRALHTPVVHVSRQKLFPKRLSNTSAEAVALRMAVNWTGMWCKENGKVPFVVFCSDDQVLVDGMRTGKEFKPGRIKDEVRLIRENVRRNLRGVSLVWTWIPGDVMKRTVINH